VAVGVFLSPMVAAGAHPDALPDGVVAHLIDTTEQKSLEQQFAQAQKMQAMGQLAGGVAHDFNNLLTAMIGFSDLLLQRHGIGDPSFADIMQIKQNANRAANLVRQLLAFSRRQPLRPRLVSVTDGLSELSHLLRRLLGERVSLRMVHGADTGAIKVDPGQFDQVIINLAVNARDAMAGGGSLTISTHREIVVEGNRDHGGSVPPGDYVVIDVADTGMGIPRENLGRLFEPFFTTKSEGTAGAGTGLGLSTVYGIVRQTEGYIFVESSPGEGATFTIYLPRHEPPAEDTPAQGGGRESGGDKGGDAAGDGDETRALTGKETILLVEDEDAVRVFGARALRNKGYTVLEARSGEGAMEVLDAGAVIDLLITDMVMPGMDGATLAGKARESRPGLRIILISGYSEDVIKGDVVNQPDTHFLPKPFSLKALAEKVREVLR
jgi:two-component system cell cycle sensor histidine kinase/response regulator CckA